MTRKQRTSVRFFWPPEGLFSSLKDSPGDMPVDEPGHMQHITSLDALIGDHFDVRNSLYLSPIKDRAGKPPSTSTRMTRGPHSFSLRPHCFSNQHQGACFLYHAAWPKPMEPVEVMGLNVADLEKALQMAQAPPIH
eukprot:CAMPEP_0174359610 /NCGR_PEP_ID=MMETSP0811_2-20130205/49655_1 /TAXON_ID=73025 ORGANISM="Eutreptiella gymnastica-like, Strain CCMP1594" /NCGR_SAMPLE_ID=MMETSP0811_2 /ASSEMBLY_ACC=CAM_ASM_000667 /LENGTH=135 /DNA_ID=CAMNT_0015494497 /DNA_START=45 /DNA_END=450 /DNA_ORIENTATION=-